jgi:hypothetical protein
MNAAPITALLVLTGCLGASPNAELADLPSLDVALLVPGERALASSVDDDTGTDVVIALEYDADGFSAAHHGDCATLDDSTRAVFDGQVLDLIEPGAYSEPSIDCVRPRFGGRIDVEHGVEHRLELSDGSHRVVATFEPGTAEPRSASPTSDADWHFRAGDTVSFGWSHAQDLALPVTAHYFLDDGTGYDFTSVTSTGAEIVLDLPPGHPIGDGVMEFLFADAYEHGDAATCDGARACTWTQRRGFKHNATIDP